MLWQRWMAPRSSDERTARHERLVNLVALGAFVAGSLYLLIVLLLSWISPSAPSPHSLINSGACIGLALLCYGLSRSGRVREALILVLVGAAAIGSYTIAVRGTDSVGVVLLAPPAVLAGFAFGGWGAILTALGEFILYLGLVLAESYGWIVPTGAPSVTSGIALTALALVLLSMICWQTVRALESALRQAAQQGEDLRALTGELERTLSKERDQRVYLQELRQKEQEHREHLQELLARIRSTAESLARFSHDILAATHQQASGTAEQSTAIAQSVSTMQEVRTIAGQVAELADGVSENAQRTAETSRQGDHAVGETIAGIQEVKQKVDEIAHTILILSEQTQAIGQIIAAVSDIASQSNMLALNAAVEAARAGESGRGFAVVATEVRALAEQSRAATQQVRDILTEIQNSVNTAVMVTEQGIKKADMGSKLAGEAGVAIQQLANSVQGSAQAALQIAAAAGQQVTGMEQIGQAMENIHQVTAQMVASTRQFEQAVEQLSGLAQQLWQTVEEYREIAGS